MEGILFRVENGKAYFDDGRGYDAEECIGILNGLVNIINTGAVKSSAPEEDKLPESVINYEDILDKRIVGGDNSKTTRKLKEWLDNDPEVIEEDEIEEGSVNNGEN